MPENQRIPRDPERNEELTDILITISVVAKLLAKRLQTQNQENEIKKILKPLDI